MDFKEIDFEKKTIMDFKEMDFNEMFLRKGILRKCIFEGNRFWEKNYNGFYGNGF